MPFVSKAQARYMFAKHPEMAKEWASKTNFKTLPSRAPEAMGGMIEKDDPKMFDPKMLSKAIRDKKKAMMMKEPEVTDSSPHMMNAQDVYDTEQLGRIESTLDVPEKSNSDEAMMEQSDADAMTVGELTDEAKRMKRLRAFMDTMDL